LLSSPRPHDRGRRGIASAATEKTPSRPSRRCAELERSTPFLQIITQAQADSVDGQRALTCLRCSTTVPPAGSSTLPCLPLVFSPLPPVLSPSVARSLCSRAASLVLPSQPAKRCSSPQPASQGRREKKDWQTHLPTSPASAF
jgi:hypothetical protein